MQEEIRIEKVALPPIELLKEGKNFLGEQYWLFLGICFVGIFIGQAIPMGLIMGAMLVGIYLCCLERHRGMPTKFETLFKGFELFGESLIAFLLMAVISFALVFPVAILMLVVTFVATAMAGEDLAGPVFVILMLCSYLAIFLVGFLVTAPFVYVFPLIAERRMKGVDAVKTSYRAFRTNMMSTITLVFVFSIVGLCLTLMCYVPGILFIPIQFAGYFVAYKRVFPDSTTEKPVPSAPPLA